MDERTLITRLGALQAPEVEASRERAVAAIAARLRGARSVAPSGARTARRTLRSLGTRNVRRGRLAFATVAFGAAAALVLVFSLGGGSEQPTPAYGAELVRFAQASPLILLEEPGWRVGDVQEQASGEGQMEFIRGKKLPPEHIVQRVTANGVGKITGMRPPAVRQRRSELNWRSGSLGSWLADRAASADFHTVAPVLGKVAKVFRYEGGRPGDYEFTALWSQGGRVLEFRAPVPDLAAFEQHLASLQRVGSQPWLEAMPAEVIKAADHGPTVAAMLKGVPLPAGFKPSQVPDAGLTTDRYQLGAAVAGTVACQWFRQWGEAIAAGDAGGVAEAERALAGAKNWPILRQMEAEGAYSQILEEYAAAMPSREWYGRPLLGDVNSGLGCAEKGVRLPRVGGSGS